MTVAALRASISYLENGISLTFAAPFRFKAPSDLEVKRILVDGTVVALSYGSDYSATGGQTDAGGTVTIGASVAGARLYVQRRTARNQAMSYSINDRFPAESHELAIDTAMMIDQEQDDQILALTTRALLVPDGEIAPLLPAIDGRGGKYLRFSADGKTIVLSEGTGEQANPFSKGFIATAGQTDFIMPFDLLVRPTVHWNGSKIGAGNYSYNGKIVSLGRGARENDIVEISVGEGVAEQILDITGPFALRDLSPDLQVPKPGIYFGVGGNSLSFQTMISSNTGTAERDNQRGMLLLAAETTDDGNSEEQTFCILTRINTGYAKPWTVSTAFQKGDNIQFSFPVNAVYRCIQGGVSAASGTGPSGTGLNILDGTCRWMWINAQAINAKLSSYIETQAFGNAGNTWGQAVNTELEPGFKTAFAVSQEIDLTNNSGLDSVFGGVTRHNLYLVTKGLTTSTASIEVATSNTTKWAAIWGLHFAGGGKLASNSIIGIDASSANGIGFGAVGGGALNPTFSDSAIKDGSTATKSYWAAGTYSIADIQAGGTSPAGFLSSGTKSLASFYDNAAAPTGLFLGGTYADWQIFGTGFSIDTVGGIAATAMRLAMGGPGSGGAAGVTGTIKVDDSYLYVCTAPSTWKRAALSAF